MDLLIPAEGTIFWTLIVFLILVFLLSKFAWKPILAAVNAREVQISDALNQAKLAKLELQELKADNERIIREAKLERDQILKEAREIKDRIVGEAEAAAKAAGDKMMEQARMSIAAEKASAMEDIKKQIGLLSVEIAESILKKNLDNKTAQEELVEKAINKSSLN